MVTADDAMSCSLKKQGITHIRDWGNSR